MTIEEAAATLGLAPDGIAPALVERNYRLKAKQCHPDRADYPGAAAEFKRATEAYCRLKMPAERRDETKGSQVDPNLAYAAETFLFGATYAALETFYQFAWADWLTWLVGGHTLRLRKTGIVKKGQFLAELRTGRGNVPPHALLVAPVDAEIVAMESHPIHRTWVLRPLETHRVEQRLADYASEDTNLESAVERLRDELFEAARLPLST